jgi:hypothetical protein
MGIRRWIHRKMWGAGRTVRYIFIHPTCGQADVEAGYLPEWGGPRFFCRRCSVAFEEATVRLQWQGDQPPGAGGGSAAAADR